MVQRIWEIAEPLATQGGFEIVDIEHRAERGGMVIRVFLDREGGVNVDDLTRVSRELGDLLEVHGAVSGAYTLETSSPGVNRRLTRPEHYGRYVGRRIRVRTDATIDGRRNFLGTLARATGDEIALELVDGAVVRIPLSGIARANYEHDFAAPKSPARHAQGQRPAAEKRRRA
jgi:ribosome maturation factor RimP